MSATKKEQKQQQREEQQQQEQSGVVHKKWKFVLPSVISLQNVQSTLVSNSK